MELHYTEGIPMDSQTPSLKSQVGQMFKRIDTDFNEKALIRHVRRLISMLISAKFKNTCAHPNCYRSFNMKELKSIYETHMLIHINRVTFEFGEDKTSELYKHLLAIACEYYNMFTATKKRDKFNSFIRLCRYKDKVRELELPCDIWIAEECLGCLRRLVINELTIAAVSSMGN